MDAQKKGIQSQKCTFRVTANRPCTTLDGFYHTTASGPFAVTVDIESDENGVFPDPLWKGLEPCFEYAGPADSREVAPPRDAAMSKPNAKPGDQGFGSSDKETQIKQAAQLLDPKNDAHWTRKGRPRSAVISHTLGWKVTNANIKESLPFMIRPGFTRDEADTEED